MYVTSTPVEKALWYIESHFTGDISLDEVSGVAGVSRFYMSRAFGEYTGHSLSSYVRGRRLTAAAYALAQGAPDILALALEVGYGSHEAFTRAFREQFGVTPEALRAQGHVHNLTLMEAKLMNQQLLTELEAPRFEEGRHLVIGGLGEQYTCESSSAIPSQWQRFAPHLGHIPGQRGAVAYGVRYRVDDEIFGYICGVEVSDPSQLPPDWTSITLTPRRYAAFTHRDHISTIRRTCATIWANWLPNSGLEFGQAPSFERYGEEFDGQTGLGGVEIWIPVKEKKDPGEPGS
jgi:AraC family transcriptional regulator